MAEYIKKEQVLEWFRPYGHTDEPIPFETLAADLRDSIPAADVAPVRHGRWESVKNPQWPAYSHDKCSICGWWNTKNALCYDNGHKPGHSLNYCPNCGARMDGGGNG